MIQETIVKKPSLEELLEGVRLLLIDGHSHKALDMINQYFIEERCAKAELEFKQYYDSRYGLTMPRRTR